MNDGKQNHWEGGVGEERGWSEVDGTVYIIYDHLFCCQKGSQQ